MARNHAARILYAHVSWIAIVAALLALAAAPDAHAQVDVLYIYNGIYNLNGSADMCQAISAAAAAYPGMILDARGFSGTQLCTAAHATTMLGGSTANPTTGLLQGKLLLGSVTLVVDGPTTNAYFEDGNGSTYGTPAIIIPASHWGIQGLSRFATTIEPCIGVNNPATGCLHAFPQRMFTVSKTILSGTTLTIYVSGTLTSTNIYV